MVTLVFKYKSDDNLASLIKEYQRQYSNCLRFLCNRICDDSSIKEPELRKLQSKLNNCDLVNKWLFQCAIKEARQIYNTHGDKVVFGGRSNLIKRATNKITKEEYRDNRLSPIYSIGEANQKGNRLFKLKEDHKVVFQPTKDRHFELDLIGVGRNRAAILDKLYTLSQSKLIGLTYKLTYDRIFISYDEKIDCKHMSQISNRIFGIDLNPNYVGWSVTEWNSSSSFKVIKTGVVSIKELNDYDCKCKVDSTKRKHISNIRQHDIIEICKKLVSTAIYYRCSKFAIEDLDFKNSDKSYTRFNRLVRNQWNRNKFVENITKRCNENGIVVVKVKPEYSSFIGKILYRNVVNEPDMVLASIEIARRGYEFIAQYIDKTRKTKKNIIFPDLIDFKDLYEKSLEEFNIQDKSIDLKRLYSYMKNAKMTYRVPVNESLIGFRLRSVNRFVYQNEHNHTNLYI